MTKLERIVLRRLGKSSQCSRHIFENGNIYVGHFVDGVMHDKRGKMVYANGDMYIGGFANGLRNGTGVASWILQLKC